jgi:hypothetical protein
MLAESTRNNATDLIISPIAPAEIQGESDERHAQRPPRERLVTRIRAVNS